MKTESEALQPANYERVAFETCRLARKMFWKTHFRRKLDIKNSSKRICIKSC